MDDIEKLLKTTIQTKVVEAFNSTPEMIDKLVEAALSKEVNAHGGPPDKFQRNGNMPFMEWLVGEEIRHAVRRAVTVYVKEHQAEIDAKVAEAVRSAELAKPLGATLARILSEEYRWHVDLKIDENR